MTMGNGMSFKAGRDMPPGMQEKMALQLAAELQRNNDSNEIDKMTAASAIVNIQEIAKKYCNHMKNGILRYLERRSLSDIRFRGKRMDGEGWVEGYLVKHPSAIHIGDYSPWYIYVPPQDPDDSGGRFNVSAHSVGQFTGLTDKNGKKIFEGDIVKCGVRSTIGVVTFGVGSFDSGIYRYIGWHVKEPNGRVDMNELYAYDEYSQIEVIGNTYDNCWRESSEIL